MDYQLNDSMANSKTHMATMVSSDLLDPTILHSQSPVERAVIRTLLFAETHQQDVAKLLEQLSFDVTSNARLALHRLAQDIRAGNPVTELLQKYPYLISSENAIAIRLASSAGDQSEVYRQILASSDVAGETWSQRPFGLSLFNTLQQFVFSVLLISFMMTFIVPTFAEMFDEFELVLPSITLLIIRASEVLAQIFPTIILLEYSRERSTRSFERAAGSTSSQSEVLIFLPGEEW